MQELVKIILTTTVFTLTVFTLTVFTLTVFTLMACSARQEFTGKCETIYPTVTPTNATPNTEPGKCQAQQTQEQGKQEQCAQ